MVPYFRTNLRDSLDGKAWLDMRSPVTEGSREPFSHVALRTFVGITPIWETREGSDNHWNEMLRNFKFNYFYDFFLCDRISIHIP